MYKQFCLKWQHANSSAGRFASRKYDVGCEWLLLKLHSNCSPQAFISASKVSKVLNSSSEPLIPLSSRERLIKNSMTEKRIETKKRRRRKEEQKEGERKERGRGKETEMQKKEIEWKQERGEGRDWRGTKTDLGRNRNEETPCGCWLPLRRVRSLCGIHFLYLVSISGGHWRAHKFHAIEKCWLNYLSTHSLVWLCLNPSNPMEHLPMLI